MFLIWSDLLRRFSSYEGFTFDMRPRLKIHGLLAAKLLIASEKKLVMCKRIRAASVNMVSMVALRLRTPSTVKSWICVSIWLSVGRFLNGQSDANGKRPRRPKY